MSRQDEVKELIRIHNDRLQELKKQQAFQGVHYADPAITLEIKNIEAQIKDLRTELVGIEGREEVSFQTDTTTSGVAHGKSQRTIIIPNTPTDNLSDQEKARLRQRREDLQIPLKTYNRRINALEKNLSWEIDEQRRVIFEEQLDDIKKAYQKLLDEIQEIDQQVGDEQ